MKLISSQLVSSEYSEQLQNDLSRATVCRFLVAYISDEGIGSLGRHLLTKALRDPRSFGVSSMTCACGYEPLLWLQAGLGAPMDGRLKYFMDPLDKQGEPKELELLHSKLVYLALELERKAVVYIGSHNWTRRALGPGGPRNAEASLRIERDFEPGDLEGTGETLASKVNQHLLRAYHLPQCLPATEPNWRTFEQWYQSGCRNASSVHLEKNTIVLAVRKDDGTPVMPLQWQDLQGGSIYLQALEQVEGETLHDNAGAVLILVWMSAADLRAGNQPTILHCRETSRNAGPNSRDRGTNQSPDRMVGFQAILFDENQLAAMNNSQGSGRKFITIWSGQPVEVYDFEFPTSRTHSSQVDGVRIPNYQFYLEIDHVIFPEDGVRPERPEMVWERESFAVVNKRADVSVQDMPGYLVTPELEGAIKDSFENTCLLDLDDAKVLPISSFDAPKAGKQITRHPLHDTFIDAKAKRNRDEFYRKSQPGMLVADIDEPQVGDTEESKRSSPKKPVSRVLRVFTARLETVP